MIRFTARRVAAVAIGAALAVGAPAAVQASAAAPARASHGTKLVVTGGVTMLRLDSGTAGVLQANDISVAPASETRVTHSGLTFPISGGAINTKTLGGYIRHVGGLTFTAGGKSLTIRDFTVRTGRKVLTAYVDEVGARITVLDLSFAKATIAVHRHTLGVRHVAATLDKQAAQALDGYFGTTLFKAGLKIGKVRVSAKTVKLGH